MLTRRETWFRFAALSISALFFGAGCSTPEVSCGGSVSPEYPTDFELQLLEVARASSVDFCTQVQGARCNLSVYETKAGWTVKATPSFPYQGRCVTRIGGERYYAFDKAGQMTDEINGL